MNANWVNEIHVGVSKSGDTWTYAKLCEGIESMEFNENEQNQQYFFLCGEGFADNETTGAAPELVVSGRRITGDDAQDYIAGLQYKLGTDRKTSVKIIAEGKQIICGATVGAITTFGGSALDVNSFGCTIRFNGKPTVSDAN